MTAPPNWRERMLREVVAFNPRHDRGLPDDLDVSFVPMPKVSERSRFLLAHESRKFGDVKRGYTHFRDGDVLFAKITPCMENGKAAIATNLTNGIGCGTTELHVLRPSDALLPEWLYFYLRQDRFREEAERNMTGSAGQLRVPLAFLEEQAIPVPDSLEEQHRIVRKLDHIAACLDDTRARLATIPTFLKRFRMSVLAAACSGKLTEDWRGDKNYAEIEDFGSIPSTWAMSKLGSLLEANRSVSYGVIKLGPDCADGIPCLRTSDVKPLGIDSSEVKRITKTISDQYHRTCLRGGELLVNVRGTLGGVAVVPRTMAGWNVSREVAVVPLDGRRLLPEFGCYWVASPSAQTWLNEVAKGVAYTGINLSDLRLLPTAIPVMDEQMVIVRRVQVMLKQADDIEARFRKANAYSEKLMPSILAKAFRGELV